MQVRLVYSASKKRQQSLDDWLLRWVEGSCEDVIFDFTELERGEVSVAEQPIADRRFVEIPDELAVTKTE
jgi:hypothetical protein